MVSAMAKPIDPKIRAAALAEMATGGAIATTAKKFGISRPTLQRWWDEAGLTPVITQEGRDQLGDAIEAWMVKAVQALTVQLDLAMDLDWLRGHSPAEFAALLSVLADQVARMAQTQEVGQPSEGSSGPIDIRSRRV